jgi:hypothetical protein
VTREPLDRADHHTHAVDAPSDQEHHAIERQALEGEAWFLRQMIEAMEADQSELQTYLEELEEELEVMRGQIAAAQTVGQPQTRPPQEWDRWILELPEHVFADLLGPAADRLHRTTSDSGVGRPQPAKQRDQQRKPSGWAAALRSGSWQ